MKQDTQLALVEPQAAITPMTLIERAASSGASVEMLQQLFELKLRVEADEARKAFNLAMASFKAKPPRISKNKHVKFGNTEYDHATLDEVTDKITAALSAVGIAHKWAVKQDAAQISVSCILTHAQGHSETTTLTAGADASGSKNAIQAIGSAVTYLQRYTLLAATGLAVAGSDNDGQGAGPEMPETAYIAHMDNIKNASTPEELKRLFSAAYKDAEHCGDTSARNAFVKAKDNRKQEMSQ